MQSFIIWITFTLLTTYWTNPKELESNNVTSNIDFKEQKNVPNKTIKFLWREEKYDEQLKGNFNLITINTEYCKTITGPEKAALAYVATLSAMNAVGMERLQQIEPILNAKYLQLYNWGINVQ